ncbi:hypothetical protein ACR9E3_09515 [Actinomycetospora sp. C-140]
MDDDDARLRCALRRFDPQWLPDAPHGPDSTASGAELTARLDGLLEFWRREHLDIRAHVRSHLDSGRALDATVLDVMRTLCRHPPRDEHRWAALHAALRRSAT